MLCASCASCVSCSSIVWSEGEERDESGWYTQQDCAGSTLDSPDHIGRTVIDGSECSNGRGSWWWWLWWWWWCLLGKCIIALYTPPATTSLMWSIANVHCDACTAEVTQGTTKGLPKICSPETASTTKITIDFCCRSVNFGTSRGSKRTP